MTDTQMSTAEDRVLDALSKVLEASVSPEMIELQNILYRRLALAGDVFPTRVPAPLNISQVGGYLNLLCDQPEIRARVLAATLGVAGPDEQTGTLPVLYFASRPNDHPAGDGQASMPVSFTVRSDLAAALDAGLASIHDSGCALPILSPARALPPLGAGLAAPPVLLALLGRTLDLVPRAALVNPSDDPLAVGSGGTGATEVLARVINPLAPNAGSVTPAVWSLWTCTGAACTQAPVTDSYLPVGPVLNAAGWFQPPITNPTTLTNQGSWSHWTNVTGLVAGSTTFGSELQLLYSTGQIVHSDVRDQLGWIWNGAAFAP